MIRTYSYEVLQKYGEYVVECNRFNEEHGSKLCVPYNIDDYLKYSAMFKY